MRFKFGSGEGEKKRDGGNTRAGVLSPDRNGFLNSDLSTSGSKADPRSRLCWKTHRDPMIICSGGGYCVRTRSHLRTTHHGVLSSSTGQGRLDDLCAVHRRPHFLRPPHYRLRPLLANSWPRRSAETGIAVLDHSIFKDYY